MIINGTLEDYFETGTEGVIWAVHENGKPGYEGLRFLETGDILTIFNIDGSLKWTGKIKPNYEIGYMKYPRNPEFGQQVSCGRWVHWIQDGFEPNAWGELFFQYNPRLHATLETKDI